MTTMCLDVRGFVLLCLDGDGVTLSECLYMPPVYENGPVCVPTTNGV